MPCSRTGEKGEFLDTPRAALRQRQSSFPKVRWSPVKSMAKLSRFKGIQTFLLPTPRPCCSTGSFAAWDTPQAGKNTLRIRTQKISLISTLFKRVKSINLQIFFPEGTEAQPMEERCLKSLLILRCEAFPGPFPKKVEQVLDPEVLGAHGGGWAGETSAKIQLLACDGRNNPLQTWARSHCSQFGGFGSTVGSSCRQWESSPRETGNICSFWWIIK